MNSDGKLDCLVGSHDGRVTFYENDGTAAVPVWVAKKVDFFEYDVGEMASPWCGEVFEKDRVDCFVGALDGKVHFFQRVGGPFTATYAHVDSNVLPYNSNETDVNSAAGFGRGRGSRGASSALASVALATGLTSVALTAFGGADQYTGGLGRAGFGFGGVRPASTRSTLSASALLAAAMGPSGASAGIQVPRSSHRTGAAPFCAFFNGNNLMDCVVGTAQGEVQFYKQHHTKVAVNASQSEAVSAQVSLDSESADDFTSFHDSSEFTLSSRSVLPASPDSFSVPSCGVDLNLDGRPDCAVGNQNGTTRVYLSQADSGWLEEGQEPWFAEVLNSDGSAMNLFGQGIGNLSPPTARPTSHPAGVALQSQPPTNLPTPGPTSTPTLEPTHLPTPLESNRPTSTPTTPVIAAQYVSPWCGDLDGDGDVDCVVGFENGEVSLYTNQGISCNTQVANFLGEGNYCSPVAQGGFALTFKRDKAWLGRNHKAAKKKHARGLRQQGHSFSVGTAEASSSSTEEVAVYDFFTGFKEFVVGPGSQTTRNVCLLSMYGHGYEGTAAEKEAGTKVTTFPLLPSPTRSHGVLARKRSACVHFYGGPSPDEGGTMCASTEHTAVTPNGRKAIKAFTEGNSCDPCQNGKGRGKARCWKRVVCYMEPSSTDPPLENQKVHKKKQCAAAGGGMAGWLVALISCLSVCFFCCCCGLLCFNVQSSEVKRSIMRKSRAGGGNWFADVNDDGQQPQSQQQQPPQEGVVIGAISNTPTPVGEGVAMVVAVPLEQPIGGDLPCSFVEAVVIGGETG